MHSPRLGGSTPTVQAEGVDSKDIRAILDAQEQLQQLTVVAVLQLADRQQQALLERAERMLSDALLFLHRLLSLL